MKYLELKKKTTKIKQWNMRETVISIVFSALGMFLKGLKKKLEELEIRGKLVIVKTTALLNLAWILRSFPKTWEDLL